MSGLAQHAPWTVRSTCNTFPWSPREAATHVWGSKGGLAELAVHSEKPERRTEKSEGGWAQVTAAVPISELGEELVPVQV